MQLGTRRALIVVDYQNDFVTGTMGFAGAKALEIPIVNKIQRAKQQGAEVLFTVDKHPPAQSGTTHCVEGSWGCALYGAVARCADQAARLFEKRTFGSMALAQYLEERQMERMEFVGVSTHLCVLSNAVLAQAACPRARIRIEAGCVASPRTEDHLRALAVMQALHIEVLFDKGGRREP